MVRVVDTTIYLVCQCLMLQDQVPEMPYTDGPVEFVSIL